MEATKKIIGAIALTAAMTAAICYAPFIGGCQSTKGLAIDPKPKIEQAQRDVKQVADGLPVRAQKIDDNAAVIQQSLPEKLLPKLSSNFTNIKVETAGIKNEDAVKLQQAVADLHVALKQNAQKDTLIGQLQTNNAKLEDEKKNGSRKLMGSLIVLAVIGLGIGGALLSTNTKLGLSLGIGSLVTLVAAVVVSSYSVWLALGGASVLVFGLVYLARKIIVEQRATTELTQTVETAKQALTLPKRKAIFGDHARHGDADLIQSETTQRLVKAERGKQKQRAKVRLATPV
jgi:hypothetical protein